MDYYKKLKRKNHRKWFFRYKEYRRSVVFRFLGMLLLLAICTGVAYSAWGYVVSGSVWLRHDDKFSLSMVEDSPGDIPDYAGDDYSILNHNIPNFTEYDLEHIAGEQFSNLDELGRCGSAVAMLHNSMMPTEEREAIGHIKPTGWHTVKYPEVIQDTYLYNRCHLIAYGLTGQNANELNLITGTRYMNASVMLDFEKRVMEYLDNSSNHVLYRVTPYFKDEELVARGIEMEAYSVEDNGEGVCFHVFIYNVQPGIEIDYATGESEIRK